MPRHIDLRRRLLDDTSGGVIFREQLFLRLGLPRFCAQVQMPELAAAHVARYTEDEVHALKLRLHLADRLQVKPSKHGGLNALVIVPGLLDAQREAVLHHLDQ